MSNAVNGRARWLFLACKARTGDSMAKLVLIALADFADESGQCWQAISTLADMCECSRRTVERALSKLEQLGMILRVPRAENGIRLPSVYRITLDASQSRIDASESRIGADSEAQTAENPAKPDTSQSRIDASESRRGSVTESHKPPIEPPKEPLKDNGAQSTPNSGKPKFDATVIDLPPAVHRESWLEWCSYRKSKRKTISEHAAARQLRLLEQYPHEVQRQIVDRSISNDYQGLFAPRGFNNGQNTEGNYQQRDTSAAGRAREKYLEWERTQQP